MPPEVISLLSSPQQDLSPPSPARREPALLRHSAAVPNLPPRKSDYDYVDLTDTPGPLPSKRGCPANNTKRINDQISRDTDFLFLSDESDTTGDLNSHTSAANDEARAAKKARFSRREGPGSPTRRILGRSLSAATSPPSRLGNKENCNDPLLESRGNHNGRPWLDFTGSDYDPFASSPPPPQAIPALPAAAPQRHPSPKKTQAWDPISSSGPEATARREDNASPSPPRRLGTCQSQAIDIFSDSDVGDSIASDESSSLPDLADVDSSKFSLNLEHSSRPARMKPKRVSASASQVAKLSKASTGHGGDGGTGASAADKARERAQKSASREAEKERKKHEREQAREQKKREKERAVALAEVNKIRTGKQTSTPEMIVDLPTRLNPTTKLQVETLLKDLDVEQTTWDSPVDNVIKWRRKVKSRYDSELGHWEPTPLHVEPENHVLVLMPAEEFVDLALGRVGGRGGDSDGEDDDDGGINSIDAHVGRMRRHFPDHTLVYLVEGLTLWLRKNRTIRNRQFAAEVRGLADGAGAAGGDSSSNPSGRRRNRPTPVEYVNEEVVEDALLNLQVVHGTLIHHTGLPVETAQWVVIFTQHISTIPYRRVREQTNDAAATFCMESGQVRTGDGPSDTYVRMLQEIVRVTAPIAYGIAAEFPTVSSLVRGMEAGGPLRLEGCRKSVNKDGVLSDRTIGQAVSRRIYKVFNGRDEMSRDV